MKRFFALLLVLALILSPATAFADETTETTEQPPHVNARIPKNLKLENADRFNPAEGFVFSFVPKADQPTHPVIDDVTVSYIARESGLKYGDINLENFANAAVGRYEYTVRETAGNTAGMTYSTRVGTLVVDKEFDGNVKSYLIIMSDDENDNTKYGNFENTFEAGNLEISKEVTGNLGDKTKKFVLIVTLTAPNGKTVTNGVIKVVKGDDETDVTFTDGVAKLELEVIDGDTYTITNLPYGVTYTVKEKGEENGELGGYTVTYDGENGTIDAADQSATVTNHKASEVPTGITLDNLPYFILLAAAFVGIGLLVVRKRVHN